jgi:putative ABC transport system permease protein
VAADDASKKRSWISHYGLTAADQASIAALPSVERVVPVRSFWQDAHRRDKRVNVRIVGTTAAVADVEHLPLAHGDFFREADDLARRNVVVVGADVAEALFAFEDPLGATVVLGKHPYVVVGVLAAQDFELSAAAAEVNRSVYLPLRTCNARFGSRVFIIEKGRRAAEQVALHALLVTVRQSRQTAAAVEDIEDVLHEKHAQKDWMIEAPGGS